MKNQTLAGYDEIIKKNKILENASKILKSEYFGIDDIIDRLIGLIKSWYIFPELLTRPNVINLWGLTGVGKTSLLRRLIELIGKNDDYIWFDLGNARTSSERHSLYERIVQVNQPKENPPFIYIFDEFQYARTIDDDGREIYSDGSRILWQILGDGFFEFWNWQNVHNIEDVLSKLNYSLSQGVKVKNGVVVEGWDTHQQIFKDYIYIDEIDSPKIFFPNLYIEDLFEICAQDFSELSELHEFLFSSDGEEIVDLVKKSVKRNGRPTKVDCSNALIFIVGNLDEAYSMNKNFNPDFSADKFYKHTLKIDLPTVKNVLLSRFRPEQIARLGNNHLIYPSLNAMAYKNIISAELEKIKEQYDVKFNMKFEFDDSLKELIYREGVFPTQGARQIFSTIENIVKNNISEIYFEKTVNKFEVDFYRLSADDEFLVAEFIRANEIIHKIRIALNLSVDNLRRVKENDTQTIIAVHESGHAIAAALILKKLPEKIISSSASSSPGGIIFLDNDENFIPKNQVIKRIAVDLAGYAAEKIVFGEENITTGSISDIEKATGFAVQMIKKCGFGKIIGNFEVEDLHANFAVFDNNYELNDEIQTLFKQALELAETTLTENNVLLLQTADYLSKNNSLTGEQFLTMLNEFAATEIDAQKLLDDSESGFYSITLKEKLNRINLKVVN